MTLLISGRSVRGSRSGLPLLVLFYNSATLGAGMEEWLSALRSAAVPLVGFLVTLAMFGSAAVALFGTGHRVLAGAFVLLVAVNSILVRLWWQD